jgi:2-isopropylmalate synthase
MVQGTINGYGERCGNADLITIIPVLSLKMGLTSIPQRTCHSLKVSPAVRQRNGQYRAAQFPTFRWQQRLRSQGRLHVNAIMKLPGPMNTSIRRWSATSVACWSPIWAAGAISL